MTETQLTARTTPVVSVRKCQHCDRPATTSVTLGNLRGRPDKCTFYCARHDLTPGVDAVLRLLRPEHPNVCAVVRAA